jgi:hypothetical protein
MIYLLRCMSRLMAQSGRRSRALEFLLSKVKRTRSRYHAMSLLTKADLVIISRKRGHPLIDYSQLANNDPPGAGVIFR